MTYREATIADIEQIQKVRNSVKENVLSDPSLVSNADCIDYITRRGKGWVCEVEGNIAGFAIADLQDFSIWALFLHPNYEGKGIGRQLHTIMMNWYFSQTQEKAWLTTAPGSRAEGFYRKAGWKEAGRKSNGEIKFEMEYQDWKTAGG